MIEHPNVEWLRARYVEDGLETPEIGKQCGVTSKTICRWLSEEGIPNRRSPISKETYDIIRKEYVTANKENVPVDLGILSKRLGHSKTTVCRCARYLGLTNRTRPKTTECDRATGIHRLTFFRFTKWTEPKIRFLADNFRSMTYHELKVYIGLGEAAIYRKLIEYGLKKQEGDRWKYQPHPRGMLGKNHSRAVCIEMSHRTRNAWADPTSVFNSDRFKQRQSDNMTRIRATHTTTNPYSRTKSGKRADLNDQFFRSGWEANFARYLNLLLKNGDIVKWEYEPDRFDFTAIQRGTRSYTPDFKIWDAVGAEPYYYEVKGWMDAKSKTRLKRMAKYYPDVKVIVFGAKEYRDLKKKLSKIIPNWEGK